MFLYSFSLTPSLTPCSRPSAIFIPRVFRFSSSTGVTFTTSPVMLFLISVTVPVASSFTRVKLSLNPFATSSSIFNPAILDVDRSFKKLGSVEIILVTVLFWDSNVLLSSFTLEFIPPDISVGIATPMLLAFLPNRDSILAISSDVTLESSPLKSNTCCS